MKHRLSYVRVENFRCAQEVSFALADYTPIVGKNNSGKSTILRAIRWLLKGGALDPSDHAVSTEVVSVAGIIEGIDATLLDALGDEHKRRIEGFCGSGRLAVRRTAGPSSSPARYIEVASLSGSEGLDAAVWVKNPTGIEAAIKALFPEPILIGAMEDAAEDAGSNKTSTTIGKLIAQLTAPLRDGHGDDIVAALEIIRTRLGATGEGRASELVEADTGVNKQLSTLFPGLTVKLHVEPPSISDLLKAGTVRIFEGENSVGREIDLLGHGAQRSVQIALIQYLAERLRDSGNTTDGRVLLLVEEPELYLHPQAIARVREALRTLSTGRFQVVVSTHSPLMLELDDLPSTVLVARVAPQPTVVRTSLREGLSSVLADAPSQSRLLMEMSNAQHILFSDRVLLAEGQTETRVLPAVFTRLMGRALDAERIGIVGPGGSGQLHKCLAVLKAMGVSVRAVADLDYALRTAPSNGLLEDGHPALDQLREITKRLSLVHGFEIAPDGFPKRGGAIGAAEAIELIAREADADAPILQLHDALLQHDVWLWRKGAIEAHFGIDGKTEGSRSLFLDRLKTEGPAHVIGDPVGVQAFFTWLTT